MAGMQQLGNCEAPQRQVQALLHARHDPAAALAARLQLHHAVLGLRSKQRLVAEGQQEGEGVAGDPAGGRCTQGRGK